MNWEEFLELCDSEVRPHFRKAETLVKEAAKSLPGKAGYEVGEAGISRTYACAIRFITPNQRPGQTFFARLAAPNKLHFCFDRLVEKRNFDPQKRQEIIGYLRNNGFSKNGAPGEMERVMDEAALDIFKHVLHEVTVELKQVNDGSRRSRGRGGAGEGAAHKTLKQYIQDNPLSVGVRLRGANAEVERKFPSNDTIDVFFENATTWIGVEVKSDQSDEDDIRRGLYQCVKYQALMEAECSVKDIKRNIRVLLALGGRLPRSLLREKTILDIEVREGVTIPG